MSNNNLDETATSQTPDPAKKASFSLSAEPVVFGEVETEQASHKFETSPAPVDTSPPATGGFEDLGELPSSYYQDVLFLAARDPRWLFTYWDFNAAALPASAFRGGSRQYFLKVVTEAGAQESLVEIRPEARNWYVPVSSPNTTYIAEIGYFSPDGAWQAVVRSAAAATPGDSVASAEGTSFATVPAHLTFERLLEMLKANMADGETLLQAIARISGEGEVQFRGGQAPTWTEEQKRLLAALLGDTLIDQLAMGSEEIDQLLRKQLGERLHSEAASLSIAGLEAMFAPGPHSLYSGIGASWSAQPFSIRRERGFFMHVNAEIIFYGGTHPDATVWVDGAQVKLQPDGTFRYHFTLPDGDFAIPIVAQSPDKVEQRSATLSFVRGTSRTGQVDSTGQPPELSPLIGKK